VHNYDSLSPSAVELVEHHLELLFKHSRVVAHDACVNTVCTRRYHTTAPYTVRSGPVPYYYVPSHPVPSHSIPFHIVLSRPIMSYPILSLPILSCPVLSRGFVCPHEFHSRTVTGGHRCAVCAWGCWFWEWRGMDCFTFDFRNPEAATLTGGIAVCSLGRHLCEGAWRALETGSCTLDFHAYHTGGNETGTCPVPAAMLQNQNDATFSAQIMPYRAVPAAKKPEMSYTNSSLPDIQSEPRCQAPANNACDGPENQPIQQLSYVLDCDFMWLCLGVFYGISAMCFSFSWCFAAPARTRDTSATCLVDTVAVSMLVLTILDGVAICMYCDNPHIRLPGSVEIFKGLM
jgi:hypothetical protein